MAIGNLIFNNGLNFRTYKSRYMVEIILNAENFPREYKIPQERLSGQNSLMRDIPP